MSWLRSANSPSSNFCELHGLLVAVTLLLRTSNNGLIICDLQSALCALYFPKPKFHNLVNKILRQLAITLQQSLVVHFLWIPFHVVIPTNDTVNILAQTARG